MNHEQLAEDVGSITGRPRVRKPFREDLAINKAIEENMTLKNTINEQRQELIRLRAEIERLRKTSVSN